MVFMTSLDANCGFFLSISSHDLGYLYYFSQIAVRNFPNPHSVYPKASITQLSYELYTSVKLDFHLSILNDQSFFAIDLHITCVIIHNLLIEKFNWLRNRWLIKKPWKYFHNVLPLLSPLSAGGKKNSQKLLLGGITIFFSIAGGNISGKEFC